MEGNRKSRFCIHLFESECLKRKLISYVSFLPIYGRLASVKREGVASSRFRELNCSVHLLDTDPSLSVSASKSLAVRARFAHAATSTHHLVDEEELLAEDWSNVQELPFDDIVIPDVGLACRQGFSGKNIHSKGLSVLEMSVLDLDQSVLWVETRVLGESTWDNQKGVSETPDSKLDLSRNFLRA